jgi:cation diffusion facilitator family transporter
MEKEKASIISIIVNIFLSIGKVFAGIISGSAALLADGLHSGLDVLSSIVAYIGIKVSSKEKDEKHPYGFYIAETLAGLGVAVLLVASAVWIIFEGVGQLTETKPVDLGVIGFAVVGVSIVANEIMARYKFRVGRSTDSLALVADGQHSRADAISSVGVLIGLILVNYFPIADGLLAVIIGLYILYESWGVGRETIDQLIGVKDEKGEEKIREIIKQKNIETSDIKTRKIGSAVFAELSIKLDPDLKMEEADKIVKDLQSELLQQIPSLDRVIIQVESHEYTQGVIKPQLGRPIKWRKRWELAKELGVKEKDGFRVIIPIKGNELYHELGAPEYMIIDKDRKEGHVKEKYVIQNPDFQEGAGGGMRIIKVTQADKVITPHMGEGAGKRAGETGVEVNIVDKNSVLEDIIKRISGE